jgi:hypothetical protein
MIIIAMCAALGIAVKPVLVPLMHIVTGPLMIPGGAMAGGLYMLFIILPVGLTQKRGAATFTCLVQAMLVIVTGVTGSHGVLSLVTYVLPGIAIDLISLTTRKKGLNAFTCFAAGLAANVTGSFLSNLVFFRLPLIPLMLMLMTAALSGCFGGLIAWQLIKRLRRFVPAFRKG